jgi:hypothetical protein
VAPFSGEPAVIVVEPSNHGTDVESAIDGVELERCAGDLCAVGNDSSLNNGAEELCAFLESQTFETAAKSVEENESSGIELETQLAGSFTRLKSEAYGKLRGDGCVVNVARNVLDFRVILSSLRWWRSTGL